MLFYYNTIYMEISQESFEILNSPFQGIYQLGEEYNTTKKQDLLGALKKYYKKYIKDDIFDTQIENLYEFYMKYNPNYELMGDINPQISEYNILILNILKDVYILWITHEFPEDVPNHEPFFTQKFEQIKEIIHRINECIRSNYMYNNVIYIIGLYFIIFNLSDDTTACLYFLDYTITRIPFIIFPSFYMLDFYKINRMIGVPIINMYITNRGFNIHRIKSNICNTISHDINFHNCRMKFGPIKDIKYEGGGGCIISMVKFFNEMYSKKTQIIKRLKTYYFIMNNVIKSIKDDIYYEISPGSTSFSTFVRFKELFKQKDIDKNMNPDMEKYIKSFFLWFVFHESSIYNNFIFNESDPNNLYQVFNFLLEYDIEGLVDVYTIFLKDIFELDVNVLEPANFIYYEYYLRYFGPFWEIIKKNITDEIAKNEQSARKYLIYKKKYLRLKSMLINKN